MHQIQTVHVCLLSDRLQQLEGKLCVSQLKKQLKVRSCRLRCEFS